MLKAEPTALKIPVCLGRKLEPLADDPSANDGEQVISGYSGLRVATVIYSTSEERSRCNIAVALTERSPGLASRVNESYRLIATVTFVE